MREAKNIVRSATKAEIEEFAERARAAETKEQVLTAFAEVMLRHARRHWVDEFWDIVNGGTCGPGRHRSFFRACIRLRGQLPQSGRHRTITCAAGPERPCPCHDNH